MRFPTTKNSLSGRQLAVSELMHQLKMLLRRMKRRAPLEINRPTRSGKTDLVHVISKKLNFSFCSKHDPNLVANWFAVGNNDRTVFRFFMENHKQLLRLISAKTS